MALAVIFPMKSANLPTASTGMVGDNIAEFIPEGYSTALTPSLILKEEPTVTAPLPDSWAITPVFTVNDGKASAEIALSGDISLYGGGEVTGPLLRNGKTIKLWNTDTGAYGVDGGSRLYQSHPWVMGVRPDGSAFGVIFDTSWKAQLTTDSDKIIFDTEGAPFRVYVIDRSTPQEVLKGLAELTGTMEMPPLWALGYHQCRFSYGSESIVRNIADNFRNRNIPCDVIWMDIDYMDGYRIFTFNDRNFPNPKALNEELHQKGFRAVYMIDPGAKVDENYHVYKSGTENDVWVKRPDGTIYQGKVWPGYCAFPDFTMPTTRQWWAGLYQDFLAKGIDGVWNDMNEPAVTDDDIPEELRIGTMPYDTPHRGGGDLPAGPHLLYHNAYGRLMTEATRNGVMTFYPERRPFVLTRANLLGGQRYAATWTGDNWAGWSHLKLSVPMSLTLGLSGQPFSGPDIGGFLNNTEPDVWAHWIGFGVFLPFVRGHACSGTNNKEPWAFGTAIEASSKMALERRYRLLPYFYTQFYNAHTTGIPVMQPIFFADPADASLRTEEESFLVGEDLMVIPAFAGNTAMPEGIWETLSVVSGDLTDQYQARLKIKGGSIIPAGRIIQNTNEAMFEPLTLFTCLDENGTAQGTLYHDAGEGWGFRDGDYSILTFTAERSGNTVIVKCTGREGNYAVDNDIKDMRVELMLDGKKYCGNGTLADGVTVRLEDLYIIGSASTAGWELDKAIAMTNEDPGIYIWTGELNKNGEFKFLPAREWALSYTPQTTEAGNTVLVPGTEYTLYQKKENEGEDNKFTVAETGIYTINVNLNDMKVSATLDKSFPDLFIVGNACKCGWDTNSAIELSRGTDGHYTLTAELTAGGNFRFLTSRNWYPTYTTSVADQQISIGTYSLVYFESQPAGEPAFKVAESGTYNIDIDLDKKLMKLTRDMSDTRLRITGNALSCGWTTDGALELDKTGDGLYSITTDLEAGGNFRFLTSENWYPTYTALYKNQPVATGSYTLVYYPSTPSGEPAFLVSEGGRYLIEVDINAMSMKLTNLTEYLFLVGSSLNGRDGVWDFSMTAEMTPTATAHEFEWTGQLYANTASGGLTEFKFLTSKKSWDGYVSLSDGNQMIENGGEYPIAHSSEAADHKFNVPADGEYHITVNTETRIMRVENGNSGIYGVEAESPVSLSIHGLNLYIECSSPEDVAVTDASGRLVSRCSLGAGGGTVALPSAGFYIVKIGNRHASKIIATYLP